MTAIKKSAPRFLLLLSVHSNLLRAALVTRELRIVAAAQQTFSTRETEFDPLEVWYKMKKVIAACLDIGRTLSREIAGLALVTDAAETVQWYESENEIVARGNFSREVVQSDALFEKGNAAQIFSGTLADWLVWNLTGELYTARANEFAKTRVRAPFDAEIPIVGMMRVEEARAECIDENVLETDRAILGVAQCAWKKVN